LAYKAEGLKRVFCCSPTPKLAKLVRGRAGTGPERVEAASREAITRTSRNRGEPSDEVGEVVSRRVLENTAARAAGRRSHPMWFAADVIGLFSGNVGAMWSRSHIMWS
jgi:hypothetical protein